VLQCLFSRAQDSVHQPAISVRQELPSKSDCKGFDDCPVFIDRTKKFAIKAGHNDTASSCVFDYPVSLKNGNCAVHGLT
jgi:hypothetical protein